MAPPSASTSTNAFIGNMESNHPHTGAGRNRRTTANYNGSTRQHSSATAFDTAPHSTAADTSLNTSYGSLSLEQIQNLKGQSHLSTLGLSPRRASGAIYRLGKSDSTRVDSSGSTSTTRPLKSKSTSRRSNSFSTIAHRGRKSDIETERSTATKGREDLSGDTSFGSDAQEISADKSGAEDEELDQEEWTMIDRMRNWRNDAMTQHLYSTAEFWGGKVFGMTGNPSDAFWLAQSHFLTCQFAQAEVILTSPKRLRKATTSSSDLSQHPKMGGRLTDTSLACRYLAAQCMVRLGKWDDALDMVGRQGLLGVNEAEEGSSENAASDGGIKLTASTAHLRGLIYLHMGSNDLAKDSFVEALSRDVKCFESFEMLVGGEMMSSDEEWEFVQGLQYVNQIGEDGDFVRMMYTVRLKKIKHRKEQAEARHRLGEEYGLSDDPDVLFGLADELYSSLRFAECYKLTSRILDLHTSHRPTLPLHLACMHHLPMLRSKLYLLAHKLVENEADDAISWYAVGLWYFSGKRWEESRRYFGKSVLIDSTFGPSWIAFAHSFAFEGEHDQAITAYSTALKYSKGNHLPLLFIGMQHLGLSNIDLAKEYLTAAKMGCKDDPLVMNELGVVAIYSGQHEDAIQLFLTALGLARNVQGSQHAWATTHLNLGHAYRLSGRLEEAHTSFRRVIQVHPRSSAAYSALGLVSHQLTQYQESIAYYHEALSLSPGDPVTCDLLKLVLEDIAFFTSSTHNIKTNPSRTGEANIDKNSSSVSLPFPGLPKSVLKSIDEQVAALDRDIMNGISGTGSLTSEEVLGKNGSRGRVGLGMTTARGATVTSRAASRSTRGRNGAEDITVDEDHSAISVGAEDSLEVRDEGVSFDGEDTQDGNFDATGDKMDITGE